jgi:hypothetical protein
MTTLVLTERHPCLTCWSRTVQTAIHRLFNAARNAGPYVLIELLLPGGTLIAILLWLARRARRPSRTSTLAKPVAGSVAAMRLAPGARPPSICAANVAAVSARLTLEQKPHDLRHDGRGPLIELCGRQVRDRVRHREKAKIGQAPRSRHSPPRYGEHVGNDRRRWNAMLFENDAVEHTARAA